MTIKRDTSVVTADVRRWLDRPPRRGDAVLLVGEPGSGKTHWLGRIVGRCGDESTTLRFVGSSFREIAFGSLHGDAWKLPGRLNPPLVIGEEAADAPSALRVAEASARALLADSSTDRLVVADGVEELDAASRHLIDCLADAHDRPFPLLVTSTRADGGFHIHEGERVGIVPYDPDQLLAVIADRVGVSVAERLADHIAGAGGNPAVALLGAAEAGRRESLPPAIAIRDFPHARHVGDVALGLLRLAALLGPTFALSSLIAATGRSATELLAAMDLLISVGILEASGSRLAFRHRWLHDSLYASYPESVRHGLHREYADRMAESRDVDAFDVAQQIAQSPTRRDTDLALLRKASSVALERNPDDAVDVLVRARAIAGPGHVGLDGLDAELVVALLAAGRTKEAHELADEVLARAPDSSVQAMLIEALSQALLYEDDLTGSVAWLDAAALDPSRSQADVNRLVAERSLRHALGGELELAKAEAEAAVRTAASHQDDLAASVANSTLAHVAYYRGDLHAAVDLARAATRAADAAASDQSSRRARYELGMFLVHADQLEEAALVFRGEQRRADALGSVWYRPLDHYGLAFCHLYRGQLAEAEREFTTGLDLTTTAETRWESTSARAHLAYVAVTRGDWRVAERLLGSVDASPTAVPHESHDATLWTKGLLLEAREDRSGALAALLAAAESAVLSGALVRLRWIVPDLARVAVGAGTATAAIPYVERLEGVSRVAGTPYVLGAARRSRAMISRDPDLMESAIRAYRSSNRVIDLAGSLEELGLMLTGIVERDRAVAALREAFELYSRVQAGGAVSRAKRALRRLGIRQPARRRRASSGWDSLTPAESEVVALATDGLTNRQIADRLFISPRTVETHLRHVYEKLGLKSRVDLATHVVGRSS